MKLTSEEEAVISRARRAVANKGKLRRIPALFGVAGIGMSAWAAHRVISKINSLEEVSEGFFFGLSLCVVATTFGIMGAICLAKVIMGFENEYEVHELLLKLHKRMAEDGVEPADARDD